MSPLIFKWTCDHCGRPVGDGLGYIEADVRAAKELGRAVADQKRKDREQAGPGAVLVRADLKAWAALSADVPWTVHHRACDPHPESSSYWFSVERCRTLEDLLDWNAHLSEKSWVRYTDWYRFIQRRLSESA